MTQPAIGLVLGGPLWPRPTVFQTRSVHLYGFAPIVRQLGRQPLEMMERFGIDPVALTDRDCYVDCSSLIDLIEHCSSSLDAPLFGVMLARQQSTRVYGLCGTLCRAAPDLGTAMEALCRYLPVIHSPQCRLEYVSSADTAELRSGSRSAFEGIDQMSYGALLSTVLLLRQLSEDRFTPVYATTRCNPSRPQHEALEQALGCRLHTRQDCDAIAFPKALSGKPLPTSDRLTFTLLSEYLRRVEAEAGHSLIERVEDFCRGAMAGNCSLRQCAMVLGMNPRALQVGLEDLGTSFSGVLAGLRTALSRNHLLTGDLSLDEIARRLGYAEQTSFGRAFRRWTGFSPGQFKAMHLAPITPSSGHLREPTH